MNHLRLFAISCLSSCSVLSVAATRPTTLLPDNVVSCQTNTGCFNKQMFGRDYRVLRTPRAEVMVSISTEGQLTRADISILNNDSFPVTVSPDDFRVEVISPRSRVLLHVAPESVPPPPPPPLAKKSKSKSKAAPVAVQAEAPKGTDQLTPDQIEQLAQLEAAAREDAQKQLVSTPVSPNEVLRGRVYFERDKHAKEVNIVLPIAGMVYQFPYVLKQ